jgi:hypothetical protein
MTAGEGAQIFSRESPAGLQVRLGIAPPTDARTTDVLRSMRLALEPPKLPTRICCSRIAVAAADNPRCETDRGVPLGARDYQVRDRYGTPLSTTATQLVYAGVEFSLSGSPPVVDQICVLPRHK